ncbi:MAG: preprotein translocase subunit SecE [Planctomycetota bacterium]
MSSVTKDKKSEDRPSLLAELFRGGLYKPNQGRIVRQVTMFTVALLGILTAWELQRSSLLAGTGGVGYAVMGALFVVSGWFAFRIVNYSVFADFLIAVEAEMSKVSWPSRSELWRASVVVMFVIFALALFLFVFDAIWTMTFELLGIRYSAEGSIVRRCLEWIGIW